MRLPYTVWDVFTFRRLAGNPLGVFRGAEGLADETLLAIARELRLSEIVFLYGPTAKGERVRIFSQTAEYPFAGHPALGAAIGLSGGRPGRIVLDLNIGPVPVEISARPEGLYGEMTQVDPVFGERHEAAAIAPLLGLTPAEIDPRWPIETVSTGRPNLIVPLRSLAAIRRVKMDWAVIARYLAAGDPARGFYLLTTETETPGAHWHARKLTPLLEDPATGSAAGAAAAWMVKHGAAASGAPVVIEQGGEMKRPSRLEVSARREAGRITAVRVGGGAVKVIDASLEL